VGNAEPPVDFDAQPPIPVSEYEETARAVNVGYDLVLDLAQCFLRARRADRAGGHPRQHEPGRPAGHMWEAVF
jgi:hypothetical protein